MALTPVTLTFAFTRPDGVVPQGEVSAVLSAPLYDTTGTLIAPTVPVTRSLDAAGQVSLPLYVTDDPDLRPSGVSWQVTERVTGAEKVTYALVLVPADAPSVSRTAKTPAVVGTPAYDYTTTSVTGSRTVSRVVTVTANYAARAGDLVLVNATAGPVTVTVPVAASAVTWTKKTDASANAVTVAPASGQLDGGTGVNVTGQYETLTVVGDGTNGWVI